MELLGLELVYVEGSSGEIAHPIWDLHGVSQLVPVFRRPWLHPRLSDLDVQVVHFFLVSEKPLIHQFVPQKSLVHVLVSDALDVLRVLQVPVQLVYFCQDLSALFIRIIAFLPQQVHLALQIHFLQVHVVLDLGELCP